MDKLIAEIIAQIVYTAELLKEFFMTINIINVLMGIGVIYIIFLRKWVFPKILSFFSLLFIMLIILVRVEAYAKSTFGADNSDISIGTARIVYLILAVLILIYNAAIKD